MQLPADRACACAGGAGAPIGMWTRQARLHAPGPSAHGVCSQPPCAVPCADCACVLSLPACPPASELAGALLWPAARPSGAGGAARRQVGALCVLPLLRVKGERQVATGEVQQAALLPPPPWGGCRSRPHVPTRVRRALCHAQHAHSLALCMYMHMYYGLYASAWKHLGTLGAHVRAPSAPSTSRAHSAAARVCVAARHCCWRGPCGAGMYLVSIR